MAVSEPASSFVDFISVQTHLNWQNTVWGRPEWRKLLGELGVRYTRSALGNRVSRQHLDALFSEYGIRSSVTFNAVNDDGSFDSAKTEDTLALIRDQLGPEKISAIEGPNEYTHKYKSGDWVGRLRAYQAGLHKAVKSDTALRQIAVLAPTIWKRIVEDYKAIGDLGESADFGNLHLYNGGRRPSRYNRDDKDEPIDTAIREAQIVVPGKPIWITETGFNTAAGGNATRWTVPPDVAAKYTLRNLAELFLRRDQVRRVNIYSLIDDEHKDDHYGLLDANLSPRPSYFALKNLMTLFREPEGGAVEASSLAVAVEGTDPDTRWQVFHKRDGRFLLMLWQDAESFDRRSASSNAVKPRPVTVTLGRTASSARVFAPTLSDAVQHEMTSAASLALDVPDHVTIVELSL